ncbi:hypothetical protein ONZ45_g716 [Pleurotus djamor]|nr:hypothetical protein ONZ45_g18937 [Pleurotus djamor]KAJ8522702.1 hypothetical protein ONZ45_g716 [Pleurotus djamor]
MTASSLLTNFDPFATHPFTNNSGVLPEPHRPSPHTSLYPGTAYAPSSSQQSRSSTQGMSKSSNGQAKPIFVPFRQDTASPDLTKVLKKKSS